MTKPNITPFRYIFNLVSNIWATKREIFQKLNKKQRWYYNNIYKSANIGKGTKIGSYVEIGENVQIGDNCSIQSFVFIPKGVIIEDNVFIGPGTIFLNDKYPPSDEIGTIRVKKGARIGGGCVILPNVLIGENALVGAGSVVTGLIPPNEVWFGNPAKFYKAL